MSSHIDRICAAEGCNGTLSLNVSNEMIYCRRVAAAAPRVSSNMWLLLAAVCTLPVGSTLVPLKTSLTFQLVPNPFSTRDSPAHGAIHARAQPKSFAPGRLGHAIADHVQFDSQALADPVKGHALIERRLRMQEAEHQLGDQMASLPAV